MRINYNSNDDNKLRDICRNFVTLFNVSLRQCSYDKENIKDTKYPELINYWLQNKLENNGIKEPDKKKFYNKLINNYEEINNVTLKKRMSYNDSTFYSNMHILYNLYEIYDKLKQRSIKYDVFIEKFQKIYNDGLITCFKGGDINFCKALQKFSNDNNNKETPFFKFCNKYYKKKQSLYTNIFNDCSKSNSKSYCILYKECKDKFKNDIELIESGSDNYISKKEEYFKKLAPDNSWIATARAIIQDSEAMSKYSTTIISTLIAFILCIFFLHKVLKNYI
ncbi:hypothetical protein PVNG_01547 [Plasmodium vivax North Korean]|uniref:Uncharacterized protein n=1 Tax=Plasmodium vivax North Korean TaxID=1035514 RepID=A0A0J9U5H9_PLAVI|nr:hypothetical protein PVNG_01547 [Plasmodium vivax North Korean]